jgi:hypothetical protein
LEETDIAHHYAGWKLLAGHSHELKDFTFREVKCGVRMEGERVAAWWLCTEEPALIHVRHDFCQDEEVNTANFLHQNGGAQFWEHTDIREGNRPLEDKGFGQCGQRKKMEEGFFIQGSVSCRICTTVALVSHKHFLYVYLRGRRRAVLHVSKKAIDA